MPVNFTRQGQRPSSWLQPQSQQNAGRALTNDLLAADQIATERKRAAMTQKRKAQFQQGLGQLFGSDKPLDEKAWGMLAKIDPGTAKDALGLMANLKGLKALEQKNALDGLTKASDMVGRFLLATKQIQDPKQRESLIAGRIQQMNESDNVFVKTAGQQLLSDFQMMQAEAEKSGAPFGADDNVIDIMLSRYALFNDMFKNEASAKEKDKGFMQTLERDRIEAGRKQKAATTQHGRNVALEGVRGQVQIERDQQKRGDTQAAADLKFEREKELRGMRHGERITEGYESEMARSTGGRRPLAATSPEMQMLPRAGDQAAAPAAGGGSPLDAIISAGRAAAPASASAAPTPDVLREFRTATYKPNRGARLANEDRLLPDEKGLFDAWFASKNKQ